MSILIALIPTIIKLMGVAETSYANVPQSGAEKKSLVMTIIEAIFGGISAVSTGGQAETWARIQAPVSAIIDSAAAIAFPHQGVIDRTDPRNV
jgi:hypothetical protein